MSWNKKRERMCIVLETAGGKKQLRFERRSISKVNEIPHIKIRSHPKGKFNFTHAFYFYSVEISSKCGNYDKQAFDIFSILQGRSAL